MATMTQMPHQPPELGRLRSGPGEKPTFTTEDDWLRELQRDLQRNMHERLREQRKEIEDEIHATLAESGDMTTEEREELLRDLEVAKEQRLKDMKALMIAEGEETIRFERRVRRLSAEDGSEISEELRREQQAILDMISKDGRRSASTSPTTDRQVVRDNSPMPTPPTTSNLTASIANHRPPAPRISPSNSASSTHTQSSQPYQQQQRKFSQPQHIWRPPTSSQNDTGYVRTSPAVNGTGTRVPQKANSVVDNATPRRTGKSFAFVHCPTNQAFI